MWWVSWLLNKLPAFSLPRSFHWISCLYSKSIWWKRIKKVIRNYSSISISVLYNINAISPIKREVVQYCDPKIMFSGPFFLPSFYLWSRRLFSFLEKSRNRNSPFFDHSFSICSYCNPKRWEEKFLLISDETNA